jgi:hypothetical protein
VSFRRLRATQKLRAAVAAVLDDHHGVEGMKPETLAILRAAMRETEEK